MNKITPAQRQEFAAYLWKWQHLLGLHRWRIVFSKKVSKHCAETEWNVDPSARLARVSLGDDFGSEEINSFNLESTALHEVLHVMLKDFKDICATKPHDADYQMWHEHEIVNMLERLLMHLDADAKTPQAIPPYRPANQGTQPHQVLV